jgi:tetratricopeptide (TPR) repeat protein
MISSEQAGKECSMKRSMSYHRSDDRELRAGSHARTGHAVPLLHFAVQRYAARAGRSMLVVALAAAACSASVAWAQIESTCGDPFKNAFGPYDYRTATPSQLEVVEQHHFTSDVESLRAGITGTLGSEIDYTLRVFPNHTRALLAMIRLGQRDRTNKPKGAHYPIECYIERAVVFRPDDPSVLQVRGIYFASQNRYSQALKDFKAVVDQQPDNANAHYNLGLAYFETKSYALAREQGKIAKELGFPLDGLRKKLMVVGEWRE